MLLAILVVMLGLYYLAFGKAAAANAARLDEKLIRRTIGEKIYRIGFKIVGAFCVAFGVLTILLIK